MNETGHQEKPLQWPVFLHPDDETTPFPPAALAMREPNGLLAVGGSLTSARLEQAYRCGIFPWFSPGQEILWWSPDPRAVLFPEKLRLARSLRKTLRNQEFEVVFDKAFADVMLACAAPRDGEVGTWITTEMIAAYTRLHKLGMAHSVEVYQDSQLVGGLYGVALGRMFFGESMFSRQRDTSKVALTWLAAQLQRWGYRAIDCQLPSDHLLRLGAQTMPRKDFLALLHNSLEQAGRQGAWRFDPDLGHALASTTSAFLE